MAQRPPLAVVQQTAELYVTTVAPRGTRTAAVDIDKTHVRLLHEGRRRAVSLAAARAAQCGTGTRRRTYTDECGTALRAAAAVSAQCTVSPSTATAARSEGASDTYGTTELVCELRETERSLVNADEYVRRLVAAAGAPQPSAAASTQLDALQSHMDKCVRTMHRLRLRLERRCTDERRAVAETIAGGMHDYGTDDADADGAAAAASATAASAAAASAASSARINAQFIDAVYGSGRVPPADLDDILPVVQRIATARYGPLACIVVTPPPR